MPAPIRPRRLKMNARRRSPLMLAVSVLATWLGVPRTAAAGGPRRGQAAAPETTLAAAGFAEIPLDPGPTAASPPDPVDADRATPATPRLSMLFQTGWQHIWTSTALWDLRSRNLFTLDLGMLVRGDDGHRWGGALTGLWYAGHRRVLGVKAIRRWTLEDLSGSYLQLAPGLLASGEDERVDLQPGLLLEAELGNKWVALATGLQVQPWQHGRWPGAAGGDVDVIWSLGGRVHGALGLGALAVCYVGLLMAFAASSGGWD